MSDVDTQTAPAAETAPQPDSAVVAATKAALANIPNSGVIVVEKKFGFRETKDELGQIRKRAPIVVGMPVPTLEGLLTELEDPKVQEYVLSSLADNVKAAIRAQIDDEDAWTKAGEKLDLTKLTLKFLANVPPAERRGGGIAKELWSAFSEDYIAVMVPATGKDAEKVGKAAQLFVAKLQPVKTNKKVLAFLKEQLDLYTVSTKNAEDYEEVIEFLNNKIKTFLEADDAVMLDNL